MKSQKKLRAPKRPKNRKRPIATYHHQRRAKAAIKKAVSLMMGDGLSTLDVFKAAQYAISSSGIKSVFQMSYGSGVSSGDENLSKQAGHDDNPWLYKISGATSDQESTYIGWVMDSLAVTLASSVVAIKMRQKEEDRKKIEGRLARKASAEVNVVHRHGILDSVEKWVPRLEVDGLSARLLWESALLPTTRPWHASRHGKTYTAQEVEDFYQRDGNIYNCHCTVVPVITSSDGTFFFQDKAQKKMNEELSRWRKHK